jgi:ferritin-like protein
MGTKGIEIVGMDVQQLLNVLNKAFADEWLAYYQYWLGAKVVKGPMKEVVIAELLQHATDELRHAGMVAGRIIQLGGTPVTEPKKWYEVTSCGYDAPDDPFVETILNQTSKASGALLVFTNVYWNRLKGRTRLPTTSYFRFSKTKSRTRKICSPFSKISSTC